MRPTRAIINLSRFRNNISQLKSIIGHNTAIMTVVKANAYGHGALRIAEFATHSDVTWLGVAMPEEGAYLREKGITLPILVLGDISKDQCEVSIRYELTQAIPSIETARNLNDAAILYGKKTKTHLKLDTGMGRIGFRTKAEILAALREMQYMKGIQIDGAFTHFATSDDADSTYAHNQMRKLESMLQILYQNGIHLNWVHASNSAGAFQFQNANYNLVRCGISIYGYYPSAFVKDQAKAKLLPVLQWETCITHIKTIEAEDSVSYGRTYIADRPRKIATLPVGYADGYRRNLSNKASVLVCGKRAPVIGRVCMDQMMIDTTHIPEASLASPVVLLGEQGTQQITADELAAYIGTISYEILTSISERVPRVYIED